MTPATTLFARICIRPVLSLFLYFPYAGLTILLYPNLGYLPLLYTQLISFLVSLDYGSYDPCVSPSAIRQRHHNVDQRKSTSGACFLFEGGVISWRSKKQSVVAQSSVEAEYIALSFAVREAL